MHPFVAPRSFPASPWQHTPLLGRSIVGHYRAPRRGLGSGELESARRPRPRSHAWARYMGLVGEVSLSCLVSVLARVNRAVHD